MTMPNIRRALIATASLSLAVTALALPTLSLAQGYPSQAVKLIVGFPPGTAPDTVTRLLGQKLEAGLKQSVVVDNRAGAGGQIATQAVAKSPADGYTLLIGEVGSISIAPPAFSKLPYDPAKELTPIAEVVRSDFVLVIPASSPHKTLADLLKAAKASKDRVNFATFGAGTPGHFGAEMLADQAGFKIEPIHYRATGDAVTAIANGDVAAAFVSTGFAAAQLKGGKMRALATTAHARSPLLTDVPTFTEAGMPKVDFSAWFALFAPAGTPAAVLDSLNKQAVAAVQSPDVKQKLVEAGFTVTGTSRADTEKMVKAEAPRWAAIVKQSGFKGD